jgi:hypothetical protein
MFVSCKSTRNSSTPAESGVEAPSNTQNLDSIPFAVTIDMQGDMYDMGDPYSILSAEIKGDYLLVRVQYGGGCREHQFESITNFAFLENIDEEGNSFPSTLRMVIKHNGNGDNCRAIIQKEILFDLQNTQDKGQKEILIQLTGWDSTLVYRYSK